MTSFLPIFILCAILSLIYVLPNLIDFSKGLGTSFEGFVTTFWKENLEIKDGEYYRLLTSIFIHADGIHLFYNLFGIFIFRDVMFLLEIAFSYWSAFLIYFAIFVFSGLCGSLLSFLFNPSPSLGASGGVFGFVGFILLATSFSNLNIWIYIALSFVISSLPGSRTDNFGHLGGLIGGVIVGILLGFGGFL